jgi:hypothetical protein
VRELVERACDEVERVVLGQGAQLDRNAS